MAEELSKLLSKQNEENLLPKTIPLLPEPAR
jgi:glucuronate isomerase